VFAVPIATVAQGGTVADAEMPVEVVEGRSRAGRDRGFSLVEVVVTITLMSVVLIPIMSAVAMSIKSSSHGRSAAQVETALVNAADRVNRAKQACEYESIVNAAMTLQGWTKDQVSLSYAYYNAPATPDLAGGGGSWVDGVACQPGTAILDQVQRVTISVTSPDGVVQREIEVVKSRV
jgi:prepilin-type N-terminal cleavage/methylation domain-containing protein